jgi:hypothetical protein
VVYASELLDRNESRFNGVEPDVFFEVAVKRRDSRPLLVLNNSNGPLTILTDLEILEVGYDVDKMGSGYRHLM